MTLPANQLIPYHEGSGWISATAAGAVVGKTFVKVSANRDASVLLNTSSTGGNIKVVTATAAGAIFGVAGHDQAVTNGKLTVVKAASGFIVPVTANGAIAAGVEVEVGVNGQVRTLASGKAVGYCVDGAVDQGDAQILIY